MAKNFRRFSILHTTKVTPDFKCDLYEKYCVHTRYPALASQYCISLMTLIEKSTSYVDVSRFFLQNCHISSLFTVTVEYKTQFTPTLLETLHSVVSQFTSLTLFLLQVRRYFLYLWFINIIIVNCISSDKGFDS